jgi:hypothetical protein
MTTIDLLETVRNKGNCFRTLHVAKAALSLLREILTEKEFSDLSLGLHHFELGESSAELNSVLKRLIKKYA